jgi:hypothetical protein
VIPQVGRPGFPMALAASRAKVKLLQPKVTSEAERDVWLLLTMVNVMASQSHSIQEIGGPSAGAAEAARDVAVEQTECMTEATGWLSGDASKLPALKAGPCLQRVRQAAAILGK